MDQLLDALSENLHTNGLVDTWEAKPSQTPLPVRFVTRNMNMEKNQDAGSLDDLMLEYVTAVQRVRQLDGAQFREGATESDSTLEGKLRKLMAALNANGSDVWEGKPEQEPLPWGEGALHLCGSVDNNALEVKSCDSTACETLESAVGQLVLQLRNGGAAQLLVHQREGAASDEHSYDAKSLGELLDELDSF
jgi:hypothetical protein